jgi:archaemetzincin
VSAVLLLGILASFAGADRIDVVPFGSIESSTIRCVARGLANRFLVPVRILNAQKLPAAALNPNRAQYIAPVILDTLASFWRTRATGEPRPGRLLAVTDADVYSPGLDFIFGQADSVDRVAIVSLYRLREEDCDLLSPPRPPVSATHRLQMARLIREAVHEIGHTYGLGHCPNASCVMFFSNNLADSDRKTSSFCPQCSAKLPWTASQNLVHSHQAR